MPTISVWADQTWGAWRRSAAGGCRPPRAMTGPPSYGSLGTSSGARGPFIASLGRMRGRGFRRTRALTSPAALPLG
eukprot:2641583-Alexandrium_andersonii.AAC.1